MSSEVVCMALGRVPVGEQRCRFLAVGLSDNTVRIISLDPSVSLLYLIELAVISTYIFIGKIHVSQEKSI